MFNFLSEKITTVKKDKNKTMNLALSDHRTYYISAHPLIACMPLIQMW